MINPKALLAGLIGASISNVTHRPTVDDIWGNEKRRSTTTTIKKRNTLQKRRWKMAKMSRKVNYQRNGTRG